jgi:hypothetical protein
VDTDVRELADLCSFETAEPVELEGVERLAPEGESRGAGPVVP